MNFTSTLFIVLLPLIFALWRALPLNRAKTFLLVMNFLLYSYWYPPYALILAFVGASSHYWALRMAACPPGRKKMYLAFCVVSTLSLVFFFKYVNFFLGSVYFFQEMLTGARANWRPEIVLPVGISFFTFQGMSYAVDVYRGHIKPCATYKDFFVYLTFFPQLVAGPIVRAGDFLPQLETRARFTEGDLRFFLYRILRGFFLKVVIADNLAPAVENLFSRNPADLTAPDAWLAAGLFAIQIFCDFAGYSDMAIGTARLLGFDILENFRNPYIATSLRNFWQRWHISLSTWFRDYLYVPLGGGRGALSRTIVNLMIVFLLSGLWHGANWTYVAWGGIHGSMLVMERLAFQNKTLKRAVGRPLWKFLYGVFTLVFVVFAWVPFRAPTMAYAFGIWKSMLGSFELTFSSGLAGGGVFLMLFLAHFTKEALREWRIIGSGENLLYFESLAYFVFIIMMPGPRSDFVYFQF